MTDAQLFRLLIRKPRPTLPIKYRIIGAESVALSVRGLRGVEVLDAHDEATDGRKLAALICAALLADGEPAFATPDEVLGLRDFEVTALGGEVVEAMALVSPFMGTTESSEVRLRLEAGARAPGNIYEALRMAECCDVTYGATERHTSYRPERYYGIAPSDLTDGQLLAFYAGCKVVSDLQRQNERK